MCAEYGRCLLFWGGGGVYHNVKGTFINVCACWGAAPLTRDISLFCSSIRIKEEEKSRLTSQTARLRWFLPLG